MIICEIHSIGICTIFFVPIYVHFHSYFFMSCSPQGFTNSHGGHRKCLLVFSINNHKINDSKVPLPLRLRFGQS